MKYLRHALYWLTVNVIVGGLLLRDLWLYGEYRGGHVWRDTSLNDGSQWCIMCGSMSDKVSCRDFALHYE